jgi:hypothetical protein
MGEVGHLSDGRGGQKIDERRPRWRGLGQLVSGAYRLPARGINALDCIILDLIVAVHRGGAYFVAPPGLVLASASSA